jgi:rod shape-determining protein MreD
LGGATENVTVTPEIGTPLASSALTTIGWLIGWGQATFFRGNLLAPPIAIVAATLVHHVIVLGILALLGWQIDWGDYLLRVTLPSAILNALILPLVYVPLRRLARWRHPQLEFR